mgnify:FL=1
MEPIVVLSAAARARYDHCQVRFAGRYCHRQGSL